MSRDELRLDARMREASITGIRKVCEKREWTLFAVNARTNHIHSVIDVKGFDTKRALAALKAGATGRLNKEGLWTSEDTPWAEKGSRRKLWNDRSIERAIDYVINGQGDDLPDFD